MVKDKGWEHLTDERWAEMVLRVLAALDRCPDLQPCASCKELEADLAAARAVLDAAQAHDSDITFAAPKVWIQVDRAAWEAWRGRQT